MVKELGGAYLAPAYIELELSEPAAGKGVPIGALVKRTSSGFELITTLEANPIPIGGVIASALDKGGGVYSCTIMVVGIWSGAAYEWDTVSGNWVDTTRHKNGVLQVPLYLV